MVTRLVIFDNDGVLVDSERIANAVLSGLLREYGHAVADVDFCVQMFVGGTMARVRRWALGAGAPLPAEFEQRYYAELFAGFRSRLRATPGARELLVGLRLAGVEVCVASSGTPERIALTHEVTGLAGYFTDRVFSAVQVGRGKPAPDLFLFAAERLGVPAQECLVVEDSPLGIAAARAAGMRCVGFAGGVVPAERLGGADRVVSELLRVRELV